MIINKGDRKKTNVAVAYTGDFFQQQITYNNKKYLLYTFFSSGTLSVTGALKNADIWLCGGGADGASSSGYGAGGAGAYCAQLLNQSLKGDYAITVGARQQASSFGSLLSANGATGKNGGTGGGQAFPYTGGTGDGITKYPFGDSTNFKCHCAGGGSGGYCTFGSYDTANAGAKGGTNGGNGVTGSKGTVPAENTASGADGGAYGGGKGGDGKGNGDQTNGQKAYFYGSGGGGAGAQTGDYGTNNATGGTGFQGVVYIRVPFENKPKVKKNSYLYYRLNVKSSSYNGQYGTGNASVNVSELELYNENEKISLTGATYSASKADGSYAFDGSTTTVWSPNATTGWVQVKLSSATVITDFRITTNPNSAWQPSALNSFEMLGSNDGTNFDILYSGAGAHVGWGAGETKIFSL